MSYLFKKFVAKKTGANLHRAPSRPNISIRVRRLFRFCKEGNMRSSNALISHIKEPAERLFSETELPRFETMIVNEVHHLEKPFQLDAIRREAEQLCEMMDQFLMDNPNIDVNEKAEYVHIINSLRKFIDESQLAESSLDSSGTEPLDC